MHIAVKAKGKQDHDIHIILKEDRLNRRRTKIKFSLTGFQTIQPLRVAQLKTNYKKKKKCI